MSEAATPIPSTTNWVTEKVEVLVSNVVEGVILIDSSQAAVVTIPCPNSTLPEVFKVMVPAKVVLMPPKTKTAIPKETNGISPDLLLARERPPLRGGSLNFKISILSLIAYFELALCLPTYRTSPPDLITSSGDGQEGVSISPLPDNQPRALSPRSTALGY